MCGICGIVGKKASAGLVEKFLDRLERRGPDSWGVFQRHNVAFGHRRLKIIDLSEASAQPLIDSHLGLAITFNGAIYNYKELRAELEEAGYSFFSQGDTEVILKAFHKWGEDCVQKLNGMFAFAIWEKNSGEVFFARDRLGIKPLYYTLTNGSMCFASSLPALLADPDVSKEINREALNYYLSFHSVVPPPHTIYKDIKKLPPGHTMRFREGGQPKIRKYWDLQFPAEPETKTEAEWQEEVLHELRLAVKRRLVADVPVGVLLSGGLDSSLLVGLLAEAGSKGLNTFSIGFESVGEEKGDEFEYSDVIAEEFQTEHHKLKIDSNKLLPSLHECILSMSEPMVSHDVIGFYLLSEAVSKHVKVVQSGQGADEVFAGYHWYPPMLETDDALAEYKKNFFDRTDERMRAVLNPEFYEKDYASELVAAHFAKEGAEHPTQKALRLDTQVMLVDDPVKRVDNMTMAFGLEARVPFLDHELVEFAAKVPSELKIKDGGKYVLKEAARSVIPAKVIDRPKGYFPVPALKYVRGEYFDFMKSVLDSKEAKERGIFKESYINDLLGDPESFITPLRGSELWQVTLLELWLQKHEASSSQ